MAILILSTFCHRACVVVRNRFCLSHDRAVRDASESTRKDNGLRGRCACAVTSSFLLLSVSSFPWCRQILLSITCSLSLGQYFHSRYSFDRLEIYLLHRFLGLRFCFCRDFQFRYFHYLGSPAPYHVLIAFNHFAYFILLSGLAWLILLLSL